MTPAERVLTLLQQHRQSLATAESLTGGLIGEWLTAVPGASRAYRGGVICYATDLKTTLAGVDPQTLAALGPVAAGTAEEMAAGVASRCDADWGLSATGVAGPERQDGHPVGQVFIGVASRQGCRLVRELTLTGSREVIRRAAAEGALELLEHALGMPGVTTRVDQS